MICRLESFELTPDFNVDVWARSEKNNSITLREKELEKSYQVLRKHYKGLHFRFLQQVHGIDSICVEPSMNGLSKNIFWGKADAAFSSQKDIVLGVRVADCIPIVFAEKDGAFCGVIHAGWRGLCSQIMTSTLAHLEREFRQVKRSKIKFWVGPHIKEDSYEVGEDVFSLFPSVFLKSSSKPEKKYLSLTMVLKAQFMKCEISNSQIMWSLENTYRNDDYYSHRKGDIGRNVIVIYNKN